MAGSALRPTRKHRRRPLLALLSGGFLLAAIILLGVEIFHFSQTRNHLPPSVTVGGVPVSGVALKDAPAIWQAVYDQPIVLDYLGSPIQLRPADIGFTLNNDQMLASLRSQVSSGGMVIVDFWNYLLRRSGPSVDIPLEATYDRDRLHAILQDIAVRYEVAASASGFDMKTLSFGNGKAGKRLDVDAAMQLIDPVLRTPTNRKVTLPTVNKASQGSDMAMLRQAMLDYLSGQEFVPTGPDTLASVVLIDLKTGQEMSINPDVAYSAESTIKIPIMFNVFRRINDVTDVNTKWLLAASILCSNNDASDTLISLVGNGNNIRNQLIDGLNQINDTVRTIGAKNTFITAPIETGNEAYRFSIPRPPTAPDKQYNSQPDAFSQTTAQDMAILLQNLYDCAEYDSGLAAAYPDSYAKSKCKQMIELLSGNIIGRMIELGVPPGTRVAHKNGWGPAGDGYNSSDSAIVYTPGGNYVLAIYMWEKLPEGHTVGSIKTWETMEGISRIVYNYFNPTSPLLESRVPRKAQTAVDCVLPSPFHPERIDFNNINNGRFDANGEMAPGACLGYPNNPSCFAKDGN